MILEPIDGAEVDEKGVIVRGLAPPGATITRDIRFWFDDHTVANSRGRWSFVVVLDPGENVLVFRIGDDVTTVRSVTVYFRPS